MQDIENAFEIKRPVKLNKYIYMYIYIYIYILFYSGMSDSLQLHGLSRLLCPWNF